MRGQPRLPSWFLSPQLAGRRPGGPSKHAARPWEQRWPPCHRPYWQVSWSGAASYVVQPSLSRHQRYFSSASEAPALNWGPTGCSPPSTPCSDARAPAAFAGTKSKSGDGVVSLGRAPPGLRGPAAQAVAAAALARAAAGAGGSGAAAAQAARPSHPASAASPEVVDLTDLPHEGSPSAHRPQPADAAPRRGTARAVEVEVIDLTGEDEAAGGSGSARGGGGPRRRGPDSKHDEDMARALQVGCEQALEGRAASASLKWMWRGHVCMDPQCLMLRRPVRPHVSLCVLRASEADTAGISSLQAQERQMQERRRQEARRTAERQQGERRRAAEREQKRQQGERRRAKQREWERQQEERRRVAQRAQREREKQERKDEELARQWQVGAGGLPSAGRSHKSESSHVRPWSAWLWRSLM